jgi:HD-like signal output (HDOD) protein
MGIDFSTDMVAQEELRDLFTTMMDEIEQNVMAIGTPETYKDAVDQLFRQFHTMKALSMYLSVAPLVEVMKTLEDILSMMRHKAPPGRVDVVDWLLLVSDEMREWAPYMNNYKYENITRIPSYMLNMVRSSATIYQSIGEILEKLTILSLSKKESDQTQFSNVLEKRVKKIHFASDAKKTVELLKTKKIDILMIPYSLGLKNNRNILEVISKKFINVPIILLHDQPANPDDDRWLKLNAFTNEVSSYLDEHDLLAVIEHVAKKHYEYKSLKLEKAPITNIIHQLKPLPDTIVKLQTCVANPDSTVKDVTDILIKEPLLCAKLLSLINSPAFALRGEISSVQQAVSLLGKDKVVALAMQSTIGESINLDVSAYDISLDHYYYLANLRMNLALDWFKKVSLSQTSTLATAALLGNIGQLLISQEVKDQGFIKTFKPLIAQTNAMVAEVEHFHTTSVELTADIMGHWKLDKNLTFALRYTYDIANAPDEYKELATALYVIYNTVPLTGEGINEDIVMDMMMLLKELNFNPEHYHKAVQKQLAK